MKCVDAVVVGGGPAGSTAAGLLASWGRSVVLVHHESPQPSLAESLPWSTRKLLRHVGLLGAVDGAGFHPNHGNISRWAGEQATAATEGAGFHVSRRDFDRLLREEARLRGASAVEGIVNRVDLNQTARVECVADHGLADYEAHFVLDCSGRSGVIARRGLRRADAGYRTLAIAAEWECPEWPPGERTHTCIDSYDNGWAWSVPLSPTRRQCTVMVDAGVTSISKARLNTLYGAELRKAVSIHSRLTAARQVTAPWGCDASLYTCHRATDSRALLVGDAASFIEPLSSAGVKKAIASAWRAAIVVNTALSQPALFDVAMTFHDRREQWLYDECVRRSQAFFTGAAQVYDDRFWTTRAEYYPPALNRAPPGDAEVRTDPAVRSMVERLRVDETARVTVAPALALDRAPVIEGNRIILRDAIAVDSYVEPLSYVCGIDLVELTRITRGSGSMSSIIDGYFTRRGPTDPRNLLLAVAFLVSKGPFRIADT